MRLIDADLPRGRMESLYEHHLEMRNFSADGAVYDCIEILDEAPTVDAEPVVRCIECKHRGTDDCPMHIKGVPADEGFLKVVDNDFCSYGERRGK